MPTVAKSALLMLAALVGLLVTGFAIVAISFDPNDLKPLLIERVQRDHQRTLAIPADVEFRLFPRLGVRLGAVSLSEQGGGETFASVQSAQLSMAVLPLLRRKIVVDRLQVQGLRATITRHTDGRTSIDDLMSPPLDQSTPPAPPDAAAAIRFDVAGMSINDASITVDDRLQGRRFVLSKAELETARLLQGTAGDVRFSGHVASTLPPLDVDLELSGRWLPELAKGRHSLSDIRAAVSGRVGALDGVKLHLGGNASVVLQARRLHLDGMELMLQAPLAHGALDLQVQVPQLGLGGQVGQDITSANIVASAALRQGQRVLRARLTLPPFTASAPRISVPGIAGVLSVDGGSLQAEARVSATLLADLEARTVELAQWVTTATLPGAKGGAVALNAQGRARVVLETESLEVQLAGQLDESRFEGRYGLRGFSVPAHDFELGVDRVDLDRYRSAGATAGAGAGGGQAPLDLSALRDLNAAGRIRVGLLKAAGVTVQQLRMDLRASAGRLVLDPLAAELYGGRATGSVSIDAGSPPRLATKQTWSGVALGPLLKEALGKQTLTGRGTLVLDVATQGATVAALKRALQGSARVELRDGSVRGFNVAQAVRSAAALLGRSAEAPAGTGSSAETTDFSELSGSFRIRGGVAHNDDLRAKSPLLRVSGSGDIDFGAGRIDYLVKATVVETLQGQGGPELQSLRGLTVPVRLTGPFDAVGYRVDTAGLLQDLARRKLQDKLGERLQGKADSTAPAAQQQLLEKLKRLLGK